MIIESIAQSGGLLLFHHKQNDCINKKICCLTGIYNTRFIRPVYPGDQMIIKIYFKKQLCGIYLFKGKVTVQETIVCQSTISLSFL